MKIKMTLYIIYVFCSINVSAQSKKCAIHLNASEFRTVIDSCDNEIIIDVRPTDNFKNKIIPNAIFVPSKSELDSFADTLDRDTPILVYCTVGVRSKNVCELLCKMEFKHVVNLKKGIEDWKKKGFNVVISENE